MFTIRSSSGSWKGDIHDNGSITDTRGNLSYKQLGSDGWVYDGGTKEGFIYNGRYYDRFGNATDNYID